MEERKVAVMVEHSVATTDEKMVGQMVGTMAAYWAGMKAGRMDVH